MIIRRSLALLCFLVTVLVARTASSQVIVEDTLRCGQKTGKFLGPLLRGSTVNDYLRLYNAMGERDSVLKFTYHADTNFKFSTTGNLHLHKDSVLVIPFHIFVSDSATTAILSINPLADSACFDTAYLYYQSIGPTRTDTSLLLRQHTPGTIAFETDRDSSKRIFLKNGADTALVIDSIYLRTGFNFRFSEQPAFFPFRLRPHDSLAVRISFIATAKGQYQDQLIVKPESPPISDAFPLVGLRLERSSVDLPAPVKKHLNVAPNPGQARLTFSTVGVVNARIAIVDMLGREVDASSDLTRWIWNRTEHGAGVAPAGVYFVILSGEDEQGEPIRETERIVLE